MNPPEIPTVRCANLRCPATFLARPGKEFCCQKCAQDFNNLVRSALLPAIKLLVEMRTQPRWSKKERARREAVAKRLGNPAPAKPKKFLFSKAIALVDDFIRDERAARDNPVPAGERARRIK